MTKSLLSAIISLVCTAAIAQDVAQWRGPNRDGIYTETGLLKKWPDDGPKMLWHYDNLGDGHTSAAVTASGVYTSGMINGMGNVFAFDHSGKLLWKKEYGKEWAENWNGTRSTPLVINDKLYLLSSYWKLVCMSTANGQIIWSADLEKDYGAKNNEWGISENLLYDGSVLYCTPGGSGASLVALDRNTGKLIWKSKSNGNKSAYCSPLMIKLKNRKLIVTMMENQVCGFDAATGNQLWQYEHINATGVHPNIPVYQNGYLYCTSGYGKGGEMLKLSDDGSSVTEVWKTKDADSRTGGVVALNGKIYASGDKVKKIFSLDWQTGKELYSNKEMAPATIIADDGLLYLYSESGKVYLVEPKADGFNIISSFPVKLGENPHWAHLVINDKKLYLRHGSSLMVFDIAAR